MKNNMFKALKNLGSKVNINRTRQTEVIHNDLYSARMLLCMKQNQQFLHVYLIFVPYSLKLSMMPIFPFVLVCTRSKRTLKETTKNKFINVSKQNLARNYANKLCSATIFYFHFSSSQHLPKIIHDCSATKNV